MGDHPEILQSGAQLWDALRQRAGLTTSTQPSEVETYDDGFVKEIRTDIFRVADGDVGELLRIHDTSPERLLTSVFRALAPYPRMAADILRMFEAAAAQHSDSNLRVAVDVAGIEAPLDLDLDSFRETVRTFERAVQMVAQRVWDANSSAMVNDIFASSGLMGGLFYSSGPVEAAPEPDAPAIRDWLAEMDRDHRFPDPPPVPLTGVPAYDALASFAEIPPAKADESASHVRVREDYAA